MKKLFLLLIFAALTSRAATYQVALPGGGTLVINGLPYANPQITNTASVVWSTNAQGLLTATATAVGTNASIIFVEGSSVSSPNFGLSTEIDPAVVTTNVTFSIVNSSITTNKIDPTFYTLLMQSGSGDVTAAGNNTFTGTNIFAGPTTISNLTITTAEVGTLILDSPIGVTAVGTNAADARQALGLTIDTDVQGFDTDLLRIARVAWASGDFVYSDAVGLTNIASGSVGRSVLAASTSADGRTALGALNIAGDTMTGPLLVPYVAYSANWTNIGTNYTPTMRAVAEKIEALSVGGYIASVSSDFQVAGSQLSVTNTVGTGRIVRETASGGAAALSSLSDVSISSTNNLHKGDFLSWSGSNWVQTLGPMGVVSQPDQWEENWFVAPGTASAFGYSLSAINGGSTGNNPGWLHGRAGYNRLSTVSTPGTFYVGGSFTINSQAFAPTNEFFGKLEVLLSWTNTVNHMLGFHDGLGSTNAPIDALYASVTNGVMKFVASMAGNTTLGSASYVVDTNMWHTIYIGATNQTAMIRVTTNGVIAFEDLISSTNVPGGGTVLTDFGCNAYTTGAGATNGQVLLYLKRLGMRYRVY